MAGGINVWEAQNLRALVSRHILAFSTSPLHFLSSSIASDLVKPLDTIIVMDSSGNPPDSLEGFAL